MKERRATSALTNVAVLERELGSVEYRLWKLGEGGGAKDGRGPLRARREDLLRRLDEENGRLERLRTPDGA